MKKIIIYCIIFVMMLICSINVIADNVSIPIIAEYKNNGVYTEADAAISIIDPFNTKVLDNVSMSEIYEGAFTYNYSCNETGVYTTSVSFYNKTTHVQLGSDTDTFLCGNENGFSLGTCPTNTNGMIGLWIFFIVILIIAIAGIALNYAVMTGASGIVYLIMSVMFWSCSDIVSYSAAVFGIIFMLISFNIKG